MIRPPRTAESRELSRLRARAYWADPSNRKRQSQLTRARMARPGISEKIAERTAAALADPETKRRQRDGLLRAWDDPAKREAQGALTRERMAGWRAARLEAAEKVLQQMPCNEREAALTGLAGAAHRGSK